MGTQEGEMVKGVVGVSEQVTFQLFQLNLSKQEPAERNFFPMKKQSQGGVRRVGLWRRTNQIPLCRMVHCNNRSSLRDWDLQFLEGPAIRAS